MISREELVNESRTYLGTPYHHQGRLKGVGLDCVGLVTGLANFTNTYFEDRLDYTPRGSGVDITKEYDKWLIPVEAPQYGDVLVFKSREKEPSYPRHCGILVPPPSGFEGSYLLHTNGLFRKVVEHVYSAEWQEKFVKAYKFHGVE